LLFAHAYGAVVYFIVASGCGSGASNIQTFMSRHFAPLVSPVTIVYMQGGQHIKHLSNIDVFAYPFDTVPFAVKHFCYMMIIYFFDPLGLCILNI
jgi:hypothetical protein